MQTKISAAKELHKILKEETLIKTINFSDKKCDACDKSCKTCKFNPFECDECELNYFRVSGSKQCIFNCGDGQYGDLGSKVLSFLY